MTHFYMTLPSNSSHNYYPENTLTRYTTRLQTPISLTGDWEVALTEISFHSSWHTIPTEGNKFRIISHIPANPEQVRPEYTTDLRVPAGFYDTMPQVVNAMLAEMERTLTAKRVDRSVWPKVSYSSVKRKADIQLVPGTVMELDDHLAAILGFSTTTFGPNTTLKTVSGDKLSDIYGGIHHVYVYCDVVENIPVGDTEAPLLRIVEAVRKKGEIVNQSFDTPRYIPVQKKNFESIEVDIRDDFGRPLPFESGKLVVTLHFRRAASPYFL